MENKNEKNYEAIKTLLKDKCGDLTIQAVLTEVAKIEYENTHLPEDFSSEKSYKQEIIRDYIEKSQNYIGVLEQTLASALSIIKHEEKATKERLKEHSELCERLKADGLLDKYLENVEKGRAIDWEELEKKF